MITELFRNWTSTDSHARNHIHSTSNLIIYSTFVHGVQTREEEKETGRERKQNES